MKKIGFSMPKIKLPKIHIPELLKRNRTILGITCIIIALFLSFGAAPLLTKASEKKIEVIRIAKAVQQGEEIKPEALQWVSVGAGSLPDEVLVEESEIIGKFAASRLYPGDYLVPDKLLSTLNTTDNILRTLDGELAVSVTIQSFAAGLSGKLQQGDIVSVLIAEDNGLPAEILPELTYVEVIASTTDKGFDTDTLDKTEEQEQPATVTLKVLPKQAGILAQLEVQGNIHIALVYRGDTDMAASYVAEQRKVLK